MWPYIVSTVISMIILCLINIVYCQSKIDRLERQIDTPYKELESLLVDYKARLKIISNKTKKDSIPFKEMERVFRDDPKAREARDYLYKVLNYIKE